MDCYKQGYEDDRFEQVVSQNFHCPICLSVLKEPVTCQRNQHCFCRPCITRHLENSQTCPTCAEELSLETLNEAPRLFVSCWSELKIRCDYFNRGCPEFVQLGDLEIHVKDCGFSPVLCSNEGCLVVISRRDQIHHESEVCEFRKVKCHDCSEMRKEMGQVKAKLEEFKEIKTDLAVVRDKIEAFEHKFDKLEAGQTALTYRIEKTKEEMMKEIRVGDNHSKNVTPRVIVAGGRKSNNKKLSSVEIFDWSERTWSRLQPMRECRAGASSFVYNDQLTVTGGRTNDDYTDTIETMNVNPVKDSTEWVESAAKLPSKVYGHSTVVNKERMISIGGFDGQKYLNQIHEVQLIQPHTVNILSTMPESRCFHGSQLFDDKICIVGGRKSSYVGDSLASVLMYDINKECKQMAPLPFAVSNMATVRWGDNVIVIGGIDKEGKVLNTVVIYNVQTGMSHMLPVMKCERKWCAAVVIQNTIVVIGGEDKQGRVLNSVEGFSFDRYSWEDLPPMNESRKMATAAVI